MTVAEAGKLNGRLGTVAEEKKGEYEAEGRPVRLDIEKGKIFADLRIGADVAGAVPLKANEGLSWQGVKLHGQGFLLEESVAKNLISKERPSERLLKKFYNGRDIAQDARNLWAIDAFGLSKRQLQEGHPLVFQHLLDRVKPERDQNNRASYRENWWIFGEARSDMRPAMADVSKIIVTTRTAKHRLFSFIKSDTIPESGLVAIAIEDAWLLATLSSRWHVCWSLSAGGWLGVGNDPVYNNSKTFDPFPFPDPTEAQKAHLRLLGEQLDAHRKAQQAAHPKLTLTAMYNVLEKHCAKEPISGKDREIYDQGLIRACGQST
ncbi:type IIL restriction-modification enzyme MmeI [Tabrizicola sp.]|uniref:type IIL restriction-modification enzyme MmeI n=1 Tax=Tabrizicola sp. TaxID=2005166 RepID=UPI003D2B432A